MNPEHDHFPVARGDFAAVGQVVWVARNRYGIEDESTSSFHLGHLTSAPHFDHSNLTHSGRNRCAGSDRTSRGVGNHGHVRGGHSQIDPMARTTPIQQTHEAHNGDQSGILAGTRNAAVVTHHDPTSLKSGVSIPPVDVHVNEQLPSALGLQENVQLVVPSQQAERAVSQHKLPVPGGRVGPSFFFRFRSAAKTPSASNARPRKSSMARRSPAMRSTLCSAPTATAQARA